MLTTGILPEALTCEMAKRKQHTASRSHHIMLMSLLFNNYWATALVAQSFGDL